MPALGQLRESHHRLAAEWHPDAAGGDAEKFRQLQEAYNTLREPATRLRHLAELEYGESGDPSRPSRHTTLFMTVGVVLQEGQAFQKRFEAAQSALAKAVLHQDRLALRERMLAVQAELDEALAEQLQELEALDARWPETTAEELLDLASSLRFLSRWLAELAEAEFNLRS